MRITWRDGVTTAAMAMAVVVERAHFHDWNWPLLGSVRWVVLGLGVLLAISFAASYLLDKDTNSVWVISGAILGLLGLGLTIAGVITANSDFAVLLTLNVLVFWMASIARHLTMSMPLSHSHA